MTRAALYARAVSYDAAYQAGTHYTRPYQDLHQADLRVFWATAEAWAYARENLCHMCHHKAEDTCEACGRPICLECSTSSLPDAVRFCWECEEVAP